MNKIMRHIKQELLNVLPAFVFFLVMFHILVVTRALVLRQYNTLPSASVVAVIGALIVAKVILIADRLPFLNLYPKKPLVWNVVLKTIVFDIIAFLFLLIEELVHGARTCGSFTASWVNMKTEIVWPAFCAREIWLTVLLVFYCSAVELARVVGYDKVKEMFFGQGTGRKQEPRSGYRAD